MFDVGVFLAEVLARAGSQAEVGRVLRLPSSRVTETYDGRRKLKLDEAVKLSERYGVPITGEAASAESLIPVLQVCLRYAPKDWTASEVQRLAEEIAFGLRLQQATKTTPPAQGRPDQDGPEEGDGPQRRRD